MSGLRLDLDLDFLGNKLVRLESILLTNLKGNVRVSKLLRN